MPSPKAVSLTQIFWLFDYDGSLCPHREEWEFGHYDPGALSQILDTLAQKSSGMVWNTGRSVESLKSQSPHFLRHPGFFEHGCYYWDGKQQHRLQSAEMAATWIEQAGEWTKSRTEWVRLEHKAHSFRLVPVRGQDRSRLRAEFRQSSLRAQLILGKDFYEAEGWRALEILVSGANKSQVVDKLRIEFPDFDKSLPIAVGDDIGDAEIVREVLRLGGLAFLVGPHCGWIAKIPHRASQIVFFRTPQDVLIYLQRVLAKGSLLEPRHLPLQKTDREA